MKDILKQAEEKMKKSIHVLSDEFAAVRAGRANPAILDKVMVDSVSYTHLHYGRRNHRTGIYCNSKRSH